VGGRHGDPEEASGKQRRSSANPRISVTVKEHTQIAKPRGLNGDRGWWVKAVAQGRRKVTLD